MGDGHSLNFVVQPTMPWNNNGGGGGNWKNNNNNRGGGGGGGWVKKNWGKPKKSFVIHKKTIWLGNLAANATFADLMALAAQIGSPVWAEVHKGDKKTGCIGFASEADAKKAVNALSGAQLDGNFLEVASYEKQQGNRD